jgi:hypothetical protein
MEKAAREYEIQADIYEKCRHPWLEECLCTIGRKLWKCSEFM